MTVWLRLTYQLQLLEILQRHSPERKGSAEDGQAVRHEQPFAENLEGRSHVRIHHDDDRSENGQNCQLRIVVKRPSVDGL
jgi:hypothetical protein